MNAHISINQDHVIKALNKLRDEGLSEAPTTGIIAKYMSSFHSNKGVPAAVSWNAQFGKYLKAHSRALEIEELRSNEPIVVDGDRTRTSIWKLVGSN